MSKDLNRRDFLKVTAATGVMATLPVDSAEAKSYRDKFYPASGRPRLSLPFSALKNEYEVVVIGSGYGGSVAAARLSSKYKVCVLERGKEWMPGEFPDRLGQMKRELFSKTNPHGLYKFSAYGDINVFMGSGLGGTSLINANIIIEPNPKVFEDSRWPREISDAYNSGELRELFSDVNEMLGGERLPENHKVPPKAKLHKATSQKLGVPHRWANLTVNYSKINNTKNHVGVFQNLCTKCGDCITGCNYGAKHTLDMNYLPMAKQNGAEIFTQITVTHVEKVSDNDYKVHYQYRKKSTMWSTKKGFIRTKKVVFGAGTMGTNKLLLASRRKGLKVSSRLGHGFSGNADILLFGYNGKRKTEILGRGADSKKLENKGIGPTIVGIADHSNADSHLNHFLVEEGAVPRAMTGLLRKITHNLSGREAWKPKNWGRMLRDVFRIGRKGAMNHSMVYLGMGHDGSDGQVHLKKSGKLKVKWKSLEKKPIFDTIRRAVKAHCNLLKAKFITPPLNTPTTVHPLGGASMGTDVSNGVTNHLGQIFDPQKGGSGVHEGLYVTDASIIPTSLAVNPLLVISALAERIVRRI